MREASRIYLGIDTSSRYLALALWTPQETLASFCEPVERDHAKRLIVELDRLFEEAGRERAELGGIGVGLGPGSYTGLRVGVATAQGLARALNIPLQGASSLVAMAYAVLDETKPKGIVALDARRGNVYAGVFLKAGNDIHLAGEIEKVARATLRDRHPDLPYFEDVTPAADYLAREGARVSQSDTAKVVTPLYL